MFDVIALGELLIDFIPHGYSKSGCKILEANPGGSSGSMLAVLSKFGKSTAFIGKVGNDEFGHFLARMISERNIDTSGLIIDSEYNTTLAFARIDADGRSSFSFYRNQGADSMLMEAEIDEKMICDSKIFSFTTFSLSKEPVRQATLKALEIAKANNVLISFNINLKPTIWKNFNTSKMMIKLGLDFADIVKITKSELDFLYGTNDEMVNAKKLLKEYKPKILFITKGENGVTLIKDDIIVYKDGFKVNTVDTTGSGNSFFGAALYKILDFNKDIEAITKEECEQIAIFANATAAICVTRHGGFLGCPTVEDVNNFIRSNLNS